VHLGEVISKVAHGDVNDDIAILVTRVTSRSLSAPKVTGPVVESTLFCGHLSRFAVRGAGGDQGDH